MARYGFLTTWCLDAPIEAVFDALRDAASYPSWWPGVQRVDLIEPGDAEGIGEVRRHAWRSVLPYTLVFDARVTGIERPHLIEGAASGELEGTGTWRLYAEKGTAAVYDWRVRTTRPWMNLAGPLARPVFGWNHDRVMHAGGLGLARLLGARLLAP
jgi:uncharacterized protein YndB with AHSA1/START domain